MSTQDVSEKAEEVQRLKVATDVLRLALIADDLARTDHPKDTYLQGQAREHVWKSYWELRAAAGDPPPRRRSSCPDCGGLLSGHRPGCPNPKTIWELQEETRSR